MNDCRHDLILFHKPAYFLKVSHKGIPCLLIIKDKVRHLFFGYRIESEILLCVS